MLEPGAACCIMEVITGFIFMFDCMEFIRSKSICKLNGVFASTVSGNGAPEMLTLDAIIVGVS
jgi:hypothetical protein